MTEPEANERQAGETDREPMYCPKCNREARPIECGDCHAIICGECGTPLERMDDLGIG